MNDIERESAIAAPLHLVFARGTCADVQRHIGRRYGMPCSASRSQSSWTSLAETCSACIHTRCTRIDAGEPIGVNQDVLATDLVVKQIEAEGGLRLRLAVELSLKVPDLIRRCQAHHQSPSPHHLQKRTRSRGPLHYPASTLLLPRPTPAVTTA
jgi:hypothetical protein